MMRLMSIGTRIFLLLGLIGCFAAGIVLAFLHNAGRIEDLGVSQVQTQMLDLQKQKLQVATHSMALSLGQGLAGISGQDGRVEFIRRALDPIRLEADKSGYYFAYQGTVNVALPPKKEIQGKDLAETKDKNGVFYVRELAKAAAAGGGFVQYVFPKPEKGDQPKLGYAEMIPGTDIWIGTGIYIDNIESAKQAIAQAIGDLVRADTQADMLQHARALDRVLQWNYYWIPNYYPPGSSTAWWNRFGLPKVQAAYDEGLDTWWEISPTPQTNAQMAERQKALP